VAVFDKKMKYSQKFLLALLACTFMTVSFIPFTAAQATTSLFKITLIAPSTANLLRRQWTLITANSFQAVGIDARTVAYTWGAIYDRVLQPPIANLGKTYDDGGFDIEAIGWTPGLFPLGGIFQIHYGKNLAPSGSNYYLWVNSTADALVEQFMSKGYTAAGMAAFKSWQEVAFEDVPKSVIEYSATPMAANPALDFQGYEWLYDNVGPVPQFIKTAMKSVVFASTGEIENLIPPASNSWYDSIVFAPVIEGLFQPDVAANMQPMLATGFTVSPDGRTFTYALRHGVKWHDGVDFTANDVLYSYMAALNPLAGAANAGYIAGYVGEDVTFVWENGTATRLVFDPDTGEGWYPANATTTRTRKGTITAVDKYTVKIDLPNFGTLSTPAATFHPEADSPAIIPMHIFEHIPFADWSTSPFATGIDTITINGQTYNGPVGTGPYEWVSFDDVTQTVHLKKNSDYWNKTALEAAGMFGIEDYYIKFIAAKDPAIAALKNGEAHILDAQYQLQQDVNAGTFGTWASVYLLKGTGIQEFGYNMRHPIIGTGTATPLGIQDPTKAAYAARCVRQALDYLIPRKLIIDNLLAGFGDPGATHVAPTNWGYDSSIAARSYDPTAAKALLAAAGYATGVAPPPSASTPVSPTGLILGTPFIVSGQFSVDPDLVARQNGFLVVLQQTKDNRTWTNVAQTVTGSLGEFTIAYAPAEAGVFFYRTFLITSSPANVSSVVFGGTIPPGLVYQGLVTEPVGQISPVVKVTVITMDSILQPLKSDIAALKTQVAGLSSDLADLSSQVSTLSSQLSTLNTLTWALGGLIVVVAVVGFYLFSRKKSE
jgi:ABC-type transport system substrate-binding protein